MSNDSRCEPGLTAAANLNSKGVGVNPQKSLHQVRVWDLPTRLFHWSLVACITGSAISGLVGGSALLWHFRFGYVVIALLAFRLVWGSGGGALVTFWRFHLRTAERS